MSRSLKRDTFPRAPLIGAGVLIAMTITFAAAARLSGFDPRMPTTAPIAARDLRFEDNSDGGIAVYDVRDGHSVAVLAPGSNGFLRATLRGLAMRRKFVGDRTTVFHLTAWADGRLTLADSTRGGLIDLEAFGRTNELAFARLLYEGERGAMIGTWITGGRTVDVPCTVEVEHTPDSLHAYVDLEGIEVGPGDSVRVHDAPVDVRFGERVVCKRRATVVLAGGLERAWTRLTAFFELTELYEVSFTPRRWL